jgi:hypothetical protein
MDPAYVKSGDVFGRTRATLGASLKDDDDNDDPPPAPKPFEEEDGRRFLFMQRCDDEDDDLAGEGWVDNTPR